MNNPLQRPVLSCFTLLAVAALLWLGTWQVQRLAWKNDLIAKVEARIDRVPVPLQDVLALSGEVKSAQYTPVSLQGHWESAIALHVVGTYESVSGFYAFSPFRLATPIGGVDRILINRGFVPADQVPENYQYAVRADDVQVSGLFRLYDSEASLAAKMAPPPDSDAPILYRREHSTFVDLLDVSLLPYYVDAQFVENVPVDTQAAATVAENTAAVMPRGGTTRVEFSNKHLGYAITWFGMAAGLIGVFGMMLRRKG